MNFGKRPTRPTPRKAPSSTHALLFLQAILMGRTLATCKRSEYSFYGKKMTKLKRHKTSEGSRSLLPKPPPSTQRLRPPPTNHP